MSYSSLKPRFAASYLKPNLTKKQEEILEQSFKKKKYPDDDEFKNLESQTGLIQFDIKVMLMLNVLKILQLVSKLISLETLIKIN